MTNSTPDEQPVLWQFFETMISELYWSERQLCDVLQTMEFAATSSDLKDAFQQHRVATLTHVRRVEEVFAIMDRSAAEEPCMGLQGIFDEGWQVIDETTEGSVARDVALIIAAQKVEHYEMACYGSIISLAKSLHFDEIAELLIPTLVEEKESDALLTEIAEGSINKQASAQANNDGAVQ